MGCLIGGGHQDSPKLKSRVNEDDKAIAELKFTRDKVRTYTKKLETCIGHCREAVKFCIQNKQKDKALLALKKQKYLEKTLDSARGEMLNLDQLISNAENALVQRDIYESLKKGNELLKNINQQLTIDDVDKLMEETADAIEYQQKIGEMLSQQVGVTNDDDLLQELDTLEVLEVDLPSVPKNVLPKREERKQERGDQETEKEWVII